MDAVENSRIVPVQPSFSAGDERRILCIIHDKTFTGSGNRTRHTNVPASISCQTLLDNIRSTFSDLLSDIDVFYKPDNENNRFIKINDIFEKKINDIISGDGKRNSFYIYSAGKAKYESCDEQSVMMRSRLNAHDINQASIETVTDNKESSDASISTIYPPPSIHLTSLPKSDTGFVGLVNQAMTCYLNSLLQTLYMTPEFRNAVYSWKFEGSDSEAALSIPYQLQRLFVQLQTSNKRAVETTDITKSFGWDSNEAWHQHDVQELCRVMFDALEKTWRSTDQENLINELYQGKLKDYVKCLKCGSVRARLDTYLDLPLVIRPHGPHSVFGYESVEEALKAFEEPEILEGNDQYKCEKCCQRCDAHKGLKITTFPYILTLHLKRFGFNQDTYQRFKLNDRMSFPEILELSCHHPMQDVNLDKIISTKDVLNKDSSIHVESSYNQKQEIIEDEGIDICENSSSQTLHDVIRSDDIDDDAAAVHDDISKTTYQYELFSIMIHSGSAAGGHYYAYIKSFKDGQWISFNDQHVFRVMQDDIEKTFGGSSYSGSYYSPYASSTNAYMLQYRFIDSMRNKDFMEVNDFPPYLKDELIRLKQKEEEEVQLQEIERNTCKIKLYVYDEFLEKCTEHKLEVHKNKTLTEATEIACKQLQLMNNDVRLDCVRLVKYDSSIDYIEESFEGDEAKEMEYILGGVKSTYNFDLLMEIKEPTEEFISHFPGGLIIRLYDVDLMSETISSPKVIRVYPDQTVTELMKLMSHKFNLPMEKMTLVLEKRFCHLHRLQNFQDTLNMEGFEKVNKVFVDCSGLEMEYNFQETKFYQLLDRFENTITLSLSLPSPNDILKLQSSQLRSIFTNSFSQPPIRDDKLTEIDEGIGESETDIHTEFGASDVISETEFHGETESCRLAQDMALHFGSRVDGASDVGRKDEIIESDVHTGCEAAKNADDGISTSHIDEEEDAVESREADISFSVDACARSDATSNFAMSEVTQNSESDTHHSHANDDVIKNETKTDNIKTTFRNDDRKHLIDSYDEEMDSANILPEDSVPLLSQDSESSQNVEIEEIPTPRSSPQVSSNGSNSPQIENVKDFTCQKESEENWDVDVSMVNMNTVSSYSYLKVLNEINGLFERTLNVHIDRRMLLRELKSALEPHVGTSTDNFRVFRCSSGPDIEMTKLSETMFNIVSGNKFSIKIGRALKPGECKVSVFELKVNEREPVKYLLEVIVSKDVCVKDFKKLLINELQTNLNLHVSFERCRLRKKTWKSPGGIYVDGGEKLWQKNDHSIVSSEIIMEIIEGPDKMESEGETLLQLYVRHWWPSKYQLDPLQEIIVSDWTVDNIRCEISKFSIIDKENVSLARARGTFPCTLGLFEVEKELEWDPAVSDISQFPMSVTDDGAVIYYKDRNEELGELTAEQKKVVQEEENIRMQNVKPQMKFPIKTTERALKIYTVDAVEKRGQPL